MRVARIYLIPEFAEGSTMTRNKRATSHALRQRNRLGVVIFVGALLISGVTGAGKAASVATSAPSPGSEIPAQPLPASVPAGFSVAAVGDLIIAHSQPDHPGPGFAGVENLLKSADIRFGNLEESLLDPFKLRIWPAPENGGDYIFGMPSVAANIKSMGFNLLSHANNHVTDWGIKGMESTDRILDKAGLVHAGTGLDLASARAPSYLTTPQGRIALVAVTSSYTAMEPAGAPFRGVAGRPGVNTLQTTLYHVVTAQQMQSLIGIFNTQAHRPTHPASADSKQLKLFGIHYCVGTTHCADVRDDNRAGTTAPGLTYKMNPHDLSRILRCIREGKEESNFEIVYIHAHNPGNWSSLSANFLPTFAHEAIDTGADEFIASGPHRLRGIEIYRGKPIFYSLGNFFFEVGQLTIPKPAFVEESPHNPDTTTNYEYQQDRLAEGFGAPIWYQSVIAVSSFDQNGNVREIKLYPLDLGYERSPRTSRGVPHLASAKLASEILQRLQRLSRPFGTRIEIDGDVGVIRVAASR